MISVDSQYANTLATTDGQINSVPALYASSGKRVFDVIVALLVIIFVLTWLVPLISIAICVTSRGPALFIQARTGRKGRPFRCFKFRTMTHESKPNSEFRQTSANDSRVTRVGGFLRKTNLDEMPQFINVLFGDMSIVGPRPHAVQHDAQFWSMPGYTERYSIKPGITGVAQVRGCRGETAQVIDMQHRVRYDHWYITRYSLPLDCKICWWTVEKMWKGDKKAF